MRTDIEADQARFESLMRDLRDSQERWIREIKARPPQIEETVDVTTMGDRYHRSIVTGLRYPEPPWKQG